jgi:hypothetical protein
MPMIGFLANGRPNPWLVAGFREGLAEAGYVEGRNVTVEYRWANTQEWRLGELAADLVRLQAKVIIVTAATSRCPRGARPYRRVMLVSLKCCFSVLLRWFAKLLRALALILCHALLAAPLHQRWD